MLILSLFVFISLGILIFLKIRKINIKTSTMAVVMALGIVTQGVLFNFFGNAFFYSGIGVILCMVILSLWFTFLVSISITLFNKKFTKVHYIHPIDRFGIGTWVAGTSICTILLVKHFKGLTFIEDLMADFNMVLWGVYLVISLLTLYKLYKISLSKKAHGILLLPTVSTQSIVILWNTLHPALSTSLNLLIISIGLLFYLFSAFLIIKRYTSMKPSWTLADDWNNTNCIFHGALSITGFACIVSHAVSERWLHILWICVFGIFVIIECIEIYRAVKRMKCYGVKNGIFIYNGTQWSRIFTFGMFYTFTYLISSHGNYFFPFQKSIVDFGIWFVLGLTLIEIGMYISEIAGVENKESMSSSEYF